MSPHPVRGKFRLSHAPQALGVLLAVGLATLCLVGAARAMGTPMPVLIGMVPGVLLLRHGRPAWGFCLVVAGLLVAGGVTAVHVWSSLCALGLMLVMVTACRIVSYTALLGRTLVYWLVLGALLRGLLALTDASAALLQLAADLSSLVLQSLLAIAGAACAAALKPVAAVRRRIIRYQRISTFDFEFCSSYLVALGLAVWVSGPRLPLVWPAVATVPAVLTLDDAAAGQAVAVVMQQPAWALGLGVVAYLLVGLKMVLANARVREPLLRTLQNLSLLLHTEPLSAPASLRPLWSPLAIVRHLDRACRHLHQLLQREKMLGALLAPHVLGQAAVIVRIRFHDGGKRFSLEADERALTLVLGLPVVEATDWHWWLSRIHPEDRAYAPDAVLHRLLSQGRLFQSFRFKHPDGHWCQLHSSLLLVEPPDASGAFSVAGVLRRDETADGSVAERSGLSPLSQAQIVLLKALLHEAYQPLNTLQLVAENGQQQCAASGAQDASASAAQFALVEANVQRLSDSLRRCRVALETTARRPQGTLIGPIIRREVEALAQDVSGEDLRYLANLDETALVTGRAPEVYHSLIEAAIQGFTAWVDEVSPPGKAERGPASITLTSDPQSQAIDVLFKFELPVTAEADSYARAIESESRPRSKPAVFAELLAAALGGVVVRRVHHGALKTTVTLPKHVGPAA